MKKFELEKELAEGLKLIKMTPFKDERGEYIKSYSDVELEKIGIDTKFVEDNYLISNKGSVRGLHYQVKNPEAKLVRCLKGSILDISVDLRKESKTYKKVFKIELQGGDNRLVYVPVGFAHGIFSLSESVVLYKSSNYYVSDDQHGVSVFSLEINLEELLKKSGIEDVIITEKDKSLKMLEEI